MLETLGTLFGGVVELVCEDAHPAMAIDTASTPNDGNRMGR
jgi:hypothetical protein